MTPVALYLVRQASRLSAGHRSVLQLPGTERFSSPSPWSEPRARAPIVARPLTGANARRRCLPSCSTQEGWNIGRFPTCWQPSTGMTPTRRVPLSRVTEPTGHSISWRASSPRRARAERDLVHSLGRARRLSTDAALASTQGRILDAAELVGSRATLYVCADSDHQRHAAPLVAGLLREVRSAAYQRSRTATVAGSGDTGDAWTGASRSFSRPPLLLVLDELANIAPLHDLPTLVAEGGSQGVVTLPACGPRTGRARWTARRTGSCRCSGPSSCLPGSATPGPSRRSLSSPASTRCPPFRSPGFAPTRARRFGAEHDQTLSMRKERVLPVDAIAGDIRMHARHRGRRAWFPADDAVVLELALARSGHGRPVARPRTARGGDVGWAGPCSHVSRDRTVGLR